MLLTTGDRVGRYEITAVLGAGGMGEVYRARDPKLHRDVAVKVLAGSGSPDPERLARFEREARILASLSHPHIGHIYEVEEADGFPALILEIVEGETLAERLAEAAPARTRMPLREALTIARQIADALGAAHEKGIIHRDLKPSNIKIAPDGTVRVIDFGIAKALASPAADAEAGTLTMTAEGTEGSILGTLGYMSPEQARGRPVDARTDIWAFGCVLFEMLAGCRAFDGATPWDTVAAILEREPDWNALAPATPPRVRDLLRRCLEKDPRRRLHAIADARIELEDAATDAVASPVRRWAKWRRARATAAGDDRRRAMSRILIAGLAIAALVVIAVAVYRGRTGATPLPRLSNPRQITAAQSLEDYPTASPDGRTVAYESNQAGNWDIWVSHLGGGLAVNRTAEHPGEDRYPSWSPDGSQMAFWSGRDGGGYYVMPALGGPPVQLAPTPGTGWPNHSPPAWSSDGRRVAFPSYTPSGTALVAALDIIDVVSRERRRMEMPGTEESRLDLRWSPDDRFLAYADGAQQPSETARIMILRLADGASVAVTDDRWNARSPFWSADGAWVYFVWNRAGAADLWRRRVTGDGEPVGEPQQVTTGLEILHAGFSAAGDRLVYAKGRWVSNVWRLPIDGDRPATWADATQVTFEHAFIEFNDVSPDGRTLAFSSDRAGSQDLWTLTLDTGELRQLTNDPAPEWAPRWSPDGRELAFYASRTGDREIYVMPAAGGPARRLTTSPGLDATPDWSPDGRWIAFRSERTGSSDIWVVPAAGGRERLIAPHTAPDYAPTFSPDGRWLAFGSQRDGLQKVWRVRFPDGGPEPVVPGISYALRWSRGDGRIYYYDTSESAVQKIWSIVPGDAAPRLVARLTGRRGTLGTQPPALDRGFVYFTWREDPADVWVMDVR